MSVRYFLLLSCCALSGFAQAQSHPIITDTAGQEAALGDIDQLFIQSRLDTYDFHTLCANASRVSQPPRNDFRRLAFMQQEKAAYLVVQPDVMRSDFVMFYEQDGADYLTYSKCQTVSILPVLALLATSAITENVASIATRQEVMAQHSFLTSHEPTRLMVRSDADEVSDYYLDFTLSTKHPLFQNSRALNRAYSLVGDVMDKLTHRDNGLFLQPYLAFTGRFSQYIGSRDSAPVVARRFNPEIFMRAWSSRGSYLDLGMAHESNGQQVSTEAGYDLVVQAYLDGGEPLEYAQAYARDGLSRGWDYSYLEWHKEWDLQLATRVQLRHYLSDGLLQGAPEEYNTWEDGGYRNRPRSQYDGVLLGIEYDLGRNRCLSGDNFICFQRVGLIQETGYSNPFENNTTTLELTSNFFGLPILLWGRTGYGSDLVDYYDNTTSWGVGIELLSR